MEALAQFANAIPVGQGHHLRGVAADLVDQQVEVVAGGERHHLEAIGKLFGQLQGLGAD